MGYVFQQSQQQCESFATLNTAVNTGKEEHFNQLIWSMKEVNEQTYKIVTAILHLFGQFKYGYSNAECVFLKCRRKEKKRERKKNIFGREEATRVNYNYLVYLIGYCSLINLSLFFLKDDRNIHILLLWTRDLPVRTATFYGLYMDLWTKETRHLTYYGLS